MSIIHFVLNNGVSPDDPLIVKRAKQIFNVDVFFGIVAPLLVWTFWKNNGVDCDYCFTLFFGISLFFLVSVFLIRFGWYKLCALITIMICLFLPLAKVQWEGMVLTTFYLVSLSLNGFIYFPQDRFWGIGIFLIHFVGAFAFSYGPDPFWVAAELETMDHNFLWGSMRLFLVILIYRIASLLIIYWSALGEQRSGEARLEALINSSNDSIWSVDRDFRLTHANGAFVRTAQAMLGLDLRSGQELRKVELPTIVTEFFRPFYQRAFKGEYIDQEQAFYHLDGKRFYALISFCPILDNRGEVIGCSAYAKNITDLKATERALRKSEKRYRGIFESSLVGMLVMKDNRIVEVNQAICRMLGYSPEEMFALGPADVVVPYNQEQYEQNTMDMLQRKIDGFTIDKAFRRKDGSILYCWLSQQAYFNKEGELDYIISSLVDRTESKLQEDVIREALRELDARNKDLKKYIESNMQLENFAYIASHDLKSPIRTIISFSQLLQRSTGDRLDERSREFLQFIVSGAENMNKLIEDLLMYSRVNTLQHQCEEVNVQELIESIQVDLYADLEEKQGRIITDQMPAVVKGDATKVRQLLQNLIINALKFQRPGVPPEVHISAEPEGDEWVFSVSDNGIGIPEEFHEKIFLLFRKLHHAGEYEGTGIGLAVCRKIVEQHGGRMWVESTPGRGTTFHFSLKQSLVLAES